MNKALLSSKRSDYETPAALFEELDAEFSFTLDPCCSSDSAKCKKYYTAEQDGLAQSWAGETVFMNPPYGRRINQWVSKAFCEAQQGATIVCLLPARTDTRWWHDYCIKGEIRFIRGRIKFGGMKNNAPFPSAVVIFHPPREGE